MSPLTTQESTLTPILATEQWRAAHTGAGIGLLELSGLDNTGAAISLDDRKRETEARLRQRYAGFSRRDFTALPVMAAYVDYYKRFDKTYHVLQQVESIALKGKRLPNVSPLVDANFAAEVETLVLTAGHDAGKLREDLTIDVSRDGDQLTQMDGTSRPMRAGDMIMRDAGGVCCSILYGQDNRSPISAATTHALYVAYAPAGVPAETVALHLQAVEEHVRLVCPTALTEQRRLLSA
jgi:DNA/RNA-binding domain of Phe-tRNA-synthetase-like protein